LAAALTWPVTIALSLAAILAGPAIMAPLCLWEGQLLSQPGQRFVPMAWSAVHAPVYLMMAAVGSAWVIGWTLHAWRTGRSRLGIIHTRLPLAILVLMIWWSARFSYACNTF
jgi:hypothetical protein